MRYRINITGEGPEVALATLMITLGDALRTLDIHNDSMDIKKYENARVHGRADRERLAEVFEAGYEAGAARYSHLLTEDDWIHDAGDVRDAFDQWLAAHTPDA